TTAAAHLRGVASQLHVGYDTLRNYLAPPVAKLGARNRVDAIRIATDSGWIYFQPRWASFLRGEYPPLVVQSAPAFCAIGPYIGARGTVKFQSALLVWYLHVIRNEKAIIVLVAGASGVVGGTLISAVEND